MVRGSLQAHERLRVRFPDLKPSELFEARCYLAALGLAKPGEDRARGTERLAPRSDCRMYAPPSLFSRVGAWLPGMAGAAFAGLTWFWLRRHRRSQRQQLFAKLGFGSVKKIDETSQLLERKSAGNVERALVLQQMPSVIQAQSLAASAGAVDACYVLSDESFDIDQLPRLRAVFGGKPVVVMTTLQIDDVLVSDSPSARLAQLVDRYRMAGDPYDVSNAIDDPAWFFGRQAELDGAQKQIMAGEHVLVLGLRKVGKSSLARQLRERFALAPMSWFDCQALGDDPKRFAATMRESILPQIDRALRARGIRLPSTQGSLADVLTRRVDAWRKRNANEPIVLIFDEIDKLAPGSDEATHLSAEARLATLTAYVDFFRALRAVSQGTQGGLAVVCVSYRPTIARKNLLLGDQLENPMFQGMREIFVGPMTLDAAVQMIEKLGRQRGVEWDAEASHLAVDLAGGLPLVCRRLASAVTRGAAVAHVDVQRVRETALDVTRRWEASAIGDYFSEAIWDILSANERSVLKLAAAADSKIELLSADQRTALVSLERFGLVAVRESRISVSGELLKSWLVSRAE